MKTFYMRSRMTNECYVVAAANQKEADTILVTHMKLPELVKEVKRYFVTYKTPSFEPPRIRTFITLSKLPNNEIDAVYSEELK